MAYDAGRTHRTVTPGTHEIQAVAQRPAARCLAKRYLAGLCPERVPAFDRKTGERRPALLWPLDRGPQTADRRRVVRIRGNRAFALFSRWIHRLRRRRPVVRSAIPE